MNPPIKNIFPSFENMFKDIVSDKMTYDKQTKTTDVNHLVEKYPDRAPVYLDKDPSAKNVPDIPKKKYLVPRTLTIGQFLYFVRRSLKLQPDQSLFLFTNGEIPSCSMLISDLYESNKSSDGLLRITYSCENTFG
jgi:GABA(A) receptor-associated protein